MSASFNCHCEERTKPVRERRWRVLKYKWNNSAFVKAGGEPSDYSTVVCDNPKCTGCGRTKAKYVDELVKLGKTS